MGTDRDSTLRAGDRVRHRQFPGWRPRGEILGFISAHIGGEDIVGARVQWDKDPCSTHLVETLERVR